jgi:hypothetical protein
VHFSQGQLRDTLGISVETFRHWKRVLPPFAERKRYTPRYSIGDLLTAAILHRLTDQCGVRVGVLPEISKAILQICNDVPWAALEGKALVVNIQQRVCQIVDASQDFAGTDVVIVLPLSPAIAGLRDVLTHKQSTVAQQQLGLRPTAVREPRARRRRA